MGITNAIQFIIADKGKSEIGYAEEIVDLDLDLGDTNDFSFVIPASIDSLDRYQYGNYIYIPGTEYGGKLGQRTTSTESNSITWAGLTWRGMLAKTIIMPPSGETHLNVSGEANSVITQVMKDRFGSFFSVSTKLSGINIKSYQFDRFIDVLSGLNAMLSSVNARLAITTLSEQTNGVFGIELSAARIHDYSGEIEYSQDNQLNFVTEEKRNGINHLVCAGKGEGTAREIVHLYVQANGSVGKTQYYKGEEERTEFYDYSSAEDKTELTKGGTERLKELQNYKKFSVAINDDMDIELGDIVGGRDRITGFTIKKPVIGKIYKVQNQKADIEYKLEGEI